MWSSYRTALRASPARSPPARGAGCTPADRLATKATATHYTGAIMDTTQDTVWHGWKAGDAFIVAPLDDASRMFAARYAWPHFGYGLSGRVDQRVWVHVSGFHLVAGLVVTVDVDNTPNVCVVTVDTLDLCARPVQA
ncbi:MAG: hypothetical protein EBR34_15295 [Sphingomonadaceae bacterium]|nr:hypothetical protein [Sphingomonadaceae bacterium]